MNDRYSKAIRYRQSENRYKRMLQNNDDGTDALQTINPIKMLAHVLFGHTLNAFLGCP